MSYYNHPTISVLLKVLAYLSLLVNHTFFRICIIRSHNVFYLLNTVHRDDTNQTHTLNYLFFFPLYYLVPYIPPISYTISFHSHNRVLLDIICTLQTPIKAGNVYRIHMWTLIFIIPNMLNPHEIIISAVFKHIYTPLKFHIH